MMKRKICGMIACVSISVVVMACGGKETSVDVPTQTVIPTVTVTQAVEPTVEPTAIPTPEPTATPTVEPTAIPTPEPTATPTVEPTAIPTPEPTATPTVEPTATPTPEPTATPTVEPTATPTPEPTATPTVEPTATSTPEPTVAPQETLTPTPEPTATPTPTPEPTATPIPEDTRKISDVKIYTGKTVEAENAKQGDVILFGACEQDGNADNGVEWIAWKVLEKADNELLLLSVNVLDAKAYHEKAAEVNWKDCDLYHWLQKDFYEGSFSEKEQASLVKTNAGNVFLLSLKEVQYYFSVEPSELYLQTISDDELVASATEYAKAKDLWTVNGKACWWLRSAGEVVGTAVEITEDGSIYQLGTEMNYSFNGVRPAIRLKLK